MNIRNFHLEKRVLLRNIQASFVISGVYCFYNFFKPDYPAMVHSVFAMLLFVGCYVLIFFSDNAISKRVVLTLYMLCVASGFFYQGGLSGINSLDFCCLIVVTLIVTSGKEKWTFLFFCVFLFVALAYVQVHHYHFIQHQHDPPVFDVIEVMCRLLTVLYIGYLYKNEFESERSKVIEINNKLTAAHDEIKNKHKFIAAYNRQLKSVIDELREERQKVIDVNQELEQLNTELNANNEFIASINESLEKKVVERTEGIAEMNRKMAQYANFTSHEIRGPLARILGLVHLVHLDYRSNGQQLEKDQLLFYIENISVAATELDTQVRQAVVLLNEVVIERVTY